MNLVKEATQGSNLLRIADLKERDPILTTFILTYLNTNSFFSSLFIYPQNNINSQLFNNMIIPYREVYSINVILPGLTYFAVLLFTIWFRD